MNNVEKKPNDFRAFLTIYLREGEEQEARPSQHLCCGIAAYLRRIKMAGGEMTMKKRQERQVT
jgi:hypothetical protein